MTTIGHRHGHFCAYPESALASGQAFAHLHCMEHETNQSARCVLRSIFAIRCYIVLALFFATATLVHAQFTFTTNNGAITITKYTGTNAVVVIPSVTNGYPVKYIGSNAFYRCGNIKSVSIGTNVSDIGDYAFYCCFQIGTVMIPSIVVNLGNSAFAYCLSLTNLSIPNSVTNIGDTAFAGSGLTSVSIPNGITSIGYQTFMGCQNLTNVIIPNSVKNIGAQAFYNCGFSNIFIPNSVTAIEDLAFYQCFALIRVTIPMSLTNIGLAPFANCSSLTAIFVDSNNAYYGSLSGVLFDKNQTTLIQCPGSIGNYTIPNSVTSIGDWAFYCCGNLTNVIIPNSVQSIGQEAFYSCGIANIIIPDSVTSIGDWAFSSCYSASSVMIGANVTNIGVNAFEGCFYLTNVTIGANVNVIGDGAFLRCYNLTSIAIPDKVTSLRNSTFSECTSLQNVIIGCSVTNIEDYCFSGSPLNILLFRGNAPSYTRTAFTTPAALIYYLYGTSGWDTSFASFPTVMLAPPVIVTQTVSALTFPKSHVSIGISLAVPTAYYSYQWQLNGTNLLNATNATYSIASTAIGNVGIYTIIVTNWAGGTMSSNVALSVVLSPTSCTNSAGSTASFISTVFSPQSLTYQWQKNGTNLADGGNISGATNDTLIISNVQDTDAAIYSAVVSDAFTSVTTSNAMLTVINPPVIIAHPTNAVVLLRTNVNFGVSLTGSTSYFRYQWQFNGTNILKATNASYAITSVTTNSAGNYSLTVTNTAGSATSSNATLSVVLSPTNCTNYASSTARFISTVFSPKLLTFQWQKNGTNLADGGNISGATNDTLIISNVQDTDAAIYSAIVSDAFTSVTTSNALLSVNDTLTFATQPQSQTVAIGNNVSFYAIAYGVPPFVFQWFFNNTPIGSPTTGNNYSAYAIANANTNHTGNYTVQVINGSGSVTSSNAVLTVAEPPIITMQPLHRTNSANTTAIFSVTATSMLPLYYQWQKNGTNLVNGGKVSGATSNILTITTISSNEAAIFSVSVTNQAGSTASSNAVLTVIYPPVLMAQPASLLVLPGTNITWGLSVNGTAPFSYYWRFNGTNLPSATNATYAITSVATNDAGNYSVIINNSAGSVTSSIVALTVLLSPTNQVKAATSNTTFTATVFNPVGMTFQWQRDGTNLATGGKYSGATSNTLTITGVTSNEAAIYSVLVSNLTGSVTSSNAALTVIYPPIITTHPIGQRLVLGKNIVLNVSAAGTAPFNYQWRFNTTNLLNATNAIYTIQAVGTANTGNYSVIVSNLAGSVTSSNALLVVLVPPSLAVQFVVGYPVLSLSGLSNNNFVVQYTTKLNSTNWIMLQSLSNLPANPYLFLDPAGVVPPLRFYRALVQ